MTGLTTMRKHSNFFKRLYNARGKKELRKLLLKANNSEIKLLVGLVFNALKGNIHLTPKLKKIGRRHQKSLRRLIEGCCTATKRSNKIHMNPRGVSKARKLISNQSGGVAPFLVPLAILAGKALLGGLISGGVAKLINRK